MSQISTLLVLPTFVLLIAALPTSHTSPIQTFKMHPHTIILLSTLLVISVSASPEDLPDRAPAPITPEDCACQCRTTIYRDHLQVVQGNCLTADTTDRKWCYINSNDCSDKFGFDNRFNLWKSYKACSSPPVDSTDCLLV